MCPLRLILIFLSATLAGFFVLRNLKSQPKVAAEDVDAEDVDITVNDNVKSSSSDSLQNPTSKVCGAIGTGFWTCVDMASGRYLWRNLVSASSSSSSPTAKRANLN